MKKLFLSIALGIAALGFSQYYPDYGNYPNNNYPNQGGYYGNDSYNYPEDYYYEYPQDYYDDGYYNSYYNDYRNSIVNVNWDRFFMEFRLNHGQIQAIIGLNNRFSNFGQWNSYYRRNPDRWYYDRYYALERILGPRIYVIFQQRFYRGYSPVVYYQNYRRTYYVPRYVVRPMYRHIDRSHYRVNGFRGNSGNHYGYGNGGYNNHDNRQRNYPQNQNNPYGFRGQGNQGSQGNNHGGGFRREGSGNYGNNQENNGGGFRRENREESSRNVGGGFRSENRTQERVVQGNGNSGGFRGGNDGGGFRNGGGNSSGEGRSESSHGRGGGFR